MIRGTGVDIVDIDRMAGLLDRWGSRFLDRVFTKSERLYCGKRSFPAMHYAAAFAAKEACLKAMGVGMAMGVHWQDMELQHNENGKPEVCLRGKGKEIACAKGIETFHLSLSHTDRLAVAFAVAEGGQ